MAKAKTVFSCRSCGAQAPKWAGQCADCGDWNTLEEDVEVSAPVRHRGYAGAAGPARVQRLSDVPADHVVRTLTGSGEFDRVLGGGLVPGSVVLLGGDPGIGKSTLLLQTLAGLSERNATLYVSGEESPQQVSLRAQRLNLAAEHLQMLPETRVEAVLAAAQQHRPRVLVIDSIQTIYTETLQSAPGAVGQVRESAAQLVRYAKESGAALFLVGHVTKDGQLAGPRVLEHMVDTVLYFEGQSGSRFRVIRAFKNRFGAVNELGVFAMSETGLKDVSNPSAIFLSRHQSPISGSAVMVTLEGSRPLLAEVQALVDESHLSNPRRVTVGLEQNRLAILLAVLHRHGGVATYDQDVFVNVVGGVRVTETGADLALLLAILSSLRDRPLPEKLITFGEVGLAGEIRPVPNGEDRLREAVKHGFTRAIVPAANAPKKAMEGIEVVGVARLSEALDAL
ncbi:DNA repair protein RadA [Thiohalomonas denitrificans]|uniref:DNA repair protein RadA n=1 Tax=Thiohalomonas denitrificans TaxID=415747 RepID=UPI0026EDC1E6|nr:DNA repair protein RadA [Thiohalomonas denitrificans]